MERDAEEKRIKRDRENAQQEIRDLEGTITENYVY